jgi:GntR family transcriptional repressor for pyruvate dehydrogenase complex
VEPIIVKYLLPALPRLGETTTFFARGDIAGPCIASRVRRGVGRSESRRLTSRASDCLAIATDGTSTAARFDVSISEPEIDEPFAEPVRPVRSFERAIENIILGVERGRLRRGDRLPNESDLAKQLDISKPSLRQALRVLERSGLLVVKPGKSGGIFMASDFLPTDAISTGIAMEERFVLDAFRARRVIETAVAGEAMASATDDDLEEIKRTVELLLVRGIRDAQVLRADAMFHRAVARATHSRVLEEALQAVYKHVTPIRDAYQESVQASAQVRDSVYEIHRQQLEAMTARDADALALALDAHFRFLEERFAASIMQPWGELFGTPAGP